MLNSLLIVNAGKGILDSILGVLTSSPLFEALFALFFPIPMSIIALIISGAALRAKTKSRALSRALYAATALFVIFALFVYFLILIRMSY